MLLFQAVHAADDACGDGDKSGYRMFVIEDTECFNSKRKTPLLGMR